MVATIWDLCSICLANPKSPNLRSCPFFIMFAGFKSLNGGWVTYGWYLIWRVPGNRCRSVVACRWPIFRGDGSPVWCLCWDRHRRVLGWCNSFSRIPWHRSTWRCFRSVVFVGFIFNFWVRIWGSHRDQLNRMVGTVLFGEYFDCDLLIGLLFSADVDATVAAFS